MSTVDDFRDETWARALDSMSATPAMPAMPARRRRPSLAEDAQWWRQHGAKAIRCLAIALGVTKSELCLRLGVSHWKAIEIREPSPPRAVRQRGRPRREIDRDVLIDALARHGSVRAAERELAIPRSTLGNYLSRNPSVAQIAAYGPQLEPRHSELLLQSGVVPEVAAARGYVSISRIKHAELQEHGFPSATSGLIVPVWSIRGGATDGEISLQRVWSQLRLDGPPSRRERYRNARGAYAVVDVPPAGRALVFERARRLYVTESPRKADAAVSRGLACVAIVGARMYRVGGDAWEAVGVRDRDVEIVLDGDASYKRDVYSAERQMAAAIERAGGRVTVRRLPVGDGLDDFLAKHPAKDAAALIAALPHVT